MRMTHIRNIPHILTHGIVHKNSPDADPNYIPIGDDTLINVRNEQLIPGSKYHIGDFIPFYFGPRTPMLYSIQHGNAHVVKRHPQEIVYCIISISDVIKYDLHGFFTDGHARSALTKFYPISRLSELNTLVKREDVYENSWGISFDNTGETKRKKSAELLLLKNVPAQMLKWFVTYNDKAKNVLVEYGIESSRIFVKPDFYF